MKSYLLVIISLLCINSAVAQEDSLLIQRRSFQPRMYWDYGQTLMLWQERSQKYEGGLEWLLFDKVQIFAEAGYRKIIPNNLYKNIDYQSEGHFYRLGIGYLAYLDEVNRLGLGMRYAESSFKDEGVIFINSETINSPMRNNFERSDLQATWMEIVLNSEKQLRLKKDAPASYWNKFFSIGIMIRYKMLLDYPSYQPIEVFSIPGYGRLINKRNLGFNLFLKINI
ncbi:MAG: DUF6048 family protein [Cyclobacteriaceae bacterium]|jgi:hypothetical protein|nr:DUF6048 family protein [Cyclobacteriaceae bacterium]